MRKFLLFPLLLGTTGLSLAAPTAAPKPAAPASATTQAGLEKIKEGELRLDGKITAVLGPGLWQLDAIAWTSPRNVRTDFDEVKPKAVQLAPDAFIHPLGSTEKVDLKNIKIKSNVAVIGKNGPDGTVRVREVILLEGYGERETVGVLTVNPISHRLINQSRAARSAGQIPKALELAKQAAERAAGSGDVSGEALCLQDLGSLYAEVDQGKNAVETFRRAQSLGERLNNPMVQVLALEGQGSVLASMGQTDQGISLLERAVTVSAAATKTIQISALSSLSRIYMSAKKNNEAVGALLRLFPLEESVGKYDDATGTLLSLIPMQATTEPAAAKTHLDEARERMGNIRDEKARMGLTLMYASALKAMKDDAGAAQQYEAAAKLAEAKGETKLAEQLRAIAAGKPATPAPGGTTPTPDIATPPADNTPNDAM